ncbi:MAG: tRNA (adenosine(37)-N6)-threonylcarbamoyltransferase complex dimerization subunit type 1 TsaB [Bacteroidales bacterium]|nr:tRNA (adenosine(37)-N6)-threonylcarbamoyltransferase complex dimerization subunit type 1 TsaB [Bacteroidales bacterium]
MAIILCIETSTEICSVAISKAGKLIALQEDSKGNSHAEQLMPLIDKILHQTNISIHQIDAVCFSEGPGSYTGLRIGLSTAKGLCYALKIPLIMVSTLQSMAWGARSLFPDKSLYCPLIDARRMEVYYAVYNNDLQLIEKVQPKIIEPDSFKEFIEKQSIVFSGNGVKKTKEFISSHPNITFSTSKNSASYMIELAFEKYKNKHVADLAYSEPFYLKEFIAGKPRVKGL